MPVAEEVIRAQDVGLWYRKGAREDSRTIILNFLHGRREKKEKFFALEGVSFSACAGEVLGVIGSNGAGKTTLCGVIGRVLRPDKGTIDVRGEVSALLSMGTGFNNELTGRENVYLNGLMLGFSRRDMRRLYEDIAAFAGLGEFMDTRIKHYSSGMKSRLGFSIAAMLNPEVLVLDEALGAGDAEFAGRASGRLKDLVAGARLVVVVTHSMEFIRKTCHRALWIDAGHIQAEGDPEKVVSAYEASIPPRQSKRILTTEYEAPETKVGDRVVTRVNNLDIRFRLNKKPFYALKGVSFDVRQGEIVGIIGANGAGKTTLCRALSRIYRPDKGSVEVFHRVSALLSMGTGFNRDLAAADNIVLNGLMLGMRKKRMKRLVNRVLAFAELEKQRNKPVKYFSKGMKARLAFSVAVAVKPGLLIIDEALSAGDLSFKQKATEAMDEMIQKAEAVIIVSHNLSFIETVCTRVIWLHKGQVRYNGDPEEAVKLYKKSLGI